MPPKTIAIVPVVKMIFMCVSLRWWVSLLRVEPKVYLPTAPARNQAHIGSRIKVNPHKPATLNSSRQSASSNALNIHNAQFPLRMIGPN